MSSMDPKMQAALYSGLASIAVDRFVVGTPVFSSRCLMVAAGFAALPYVYPMLNYPIAFIDSQPLFFPVAAAVGTYLVSRY